MVKTKKKVQKQKRTTLAVFMVAIAAITLIGATLVSRTSASQEHIPIILVHGYNNRIGNCQGVRVSSYWGSTKTELTKKIGIADADIIPVSYYNCDVLGVDITGSGPGTDYPLTSTASGAYPRAGHTNNASITRISQDLAWFTYNQFNKKGKPVYMVGHSMGGLIIREALRNVQAGNPAFPPSLDVPRALTISTPHSGWKQDCVSNTQCSEMTPGSQFLTNLQSNPGPQGYSGTKWWAMGSKGKTSDCDFIPASSATAVQGEALIYTNPCYTHNQYLTDSIQTLNAQGSGPIGGRHSLAMLGYILK
jgi:hypothetical protein